MDVMETEQFETLARNWIEAEEQGDGAAAQAFEDELHERIDLDGIRTIRGLDESSGEPSPAATDRLRAALERMWTNASERLD